MQFNEKLKELRTKKGVSQSELADGIYVSRSAVAKWENGLGLPSTESLRLLAEYFGVGVDELYADSSTEKVIVNKNKIISRSRKILIIISTACAVAVTAIIILAIFLGYQLNKPAPHGENNYYTGPLGVNGQLYCGGVEFDYENNEWLSERSEWESIKRDEDKWLPDEERTRVKYTLTAEQSYVLGVHPSPSGFNGHAVGISFAIVDFEYDSDIFEIVYGLPKGFSKYYSKEEGYANYYAGEINYLLTVKKPCQNEPIFLYRGKKTDGNQPSFELRISAVPSEEQL